MKSFKDKLNSKKIPQHVAIIMDGNGRWAAKHGSARIHGHEHGVDAVRSTVEGAGEIGIKHLTLYAFSEENWKRPQSHLRTAAITWVWQKCSNRPQRNVATFSPIDVWLLVRMVGRFNMLTFQV